MTEEERALWVAVYAAVVGGAVAGPHGFHYIQPSGTRMAAESARVYANLAVLDLRAALKEKK